MHTQTNSLSLAQQGHLTAPHAYWKLSNPKKENLTNGCGPKVLPDFLTPNNLFGVDIKQACDIHDYMYSSSTKTGARKLADKTFLKNMNAIIKKERFSFAMRLLSKAKAYTFYLCVCIFGGLFFAKPPAQSK